MLQSEAKGWRGARLLKTPNQDTSDLCADLTGSRHDENCPDCPSGGSYLAALICSATSPRSIDVLQNSGMCS